jgi:hypothetical protein
MIVKSDEQLRQNQEGLCRLPLPSEVKGRQARGTKRDICQNVRSTSQCIVAKYPIRVHDTFHDMRRQLTSLRI